MSKIEHAIVHVSRDRLGKIRSGVIFASLLILLILSVVMNVGLAGKLRSANAKLAAVELETTLVEGQHLPDIEGKDLTGDFVTHSLSGDPRPTVIYVFSPSCGWCEKNRANMQVLSASASEKYRFVGLAMSTKNLPEYVEKQGWRFPVIKDLTADTILSLKLGGTPQTIVVAPNGKVERNWIGAFMNKRQTEVEDYFQVKLPGLPQE